ncbi:MAG: nickel pincer cofactor biosynthesis protein LarB [Promethearchaeota archaeon]
MNSMDSMKSMKSIRDVLELLKAGEISGEEAARRLELMVKTTYVERVGELARLDPFRGERTGVPEVIFAETKPVEATLRIVESMLEKTGYAVVTRTPAETVGVLRARYGGDDKRTISVNEPARVVVVRNSGFEFSRHGGKVGLVSAGTSDIPVAEEAKVTAEVMGCEVISSYDVGIAGMHRIFEPVREMLEAGVDAIIVVAGMEGTLPGVVASLVDVPVIGVPVSSGYGLGGGGKGALTTMLQSCSPGLVVVNIDNGFGAGTAAALISRRVSSRVGSGATSRTGSDANASPGN